MTGLQIRRAEAGDAPALLTIYAPIVLTTAISFEIEVPSEAEFAARIETANRDHVWLVAQSGSGVAGYAYAGPLRARAAYRYSVETSVYVAENSRGHGVGGELYRHLLDELARLGYFHAYAGITMPNDGSLAVHRRMGFRLVGTFPEVGFKFGRWHDVAWWYRRIGPGTPG